MPTLGVSFSALCHPSLSDVHSGRVLFCFMSPLSLWCLLWACLILLHVISLCLMPTLGVSYSASCHLSLSDAHSGRVLFCFMSPLSLWYPLWACLILLHVISLCLMPTLGVSYSASCHLSLCLMPTLGVSYSASCHPSLSDTHYGRVLFCFMSSLSVWCPFWACLILLHVISLCLMPTLGVSYSASCHPSLSDTHSGRVLFCFMSSLSLSDAHSGRVLFCFMSSLSVWCPLWACLILLHVIPLCLMPTLGVSYSASCHLSLSDAHSGRVLFCFMSSLSLSDTHSGRVLFCFMSSLSLWCPLWACLILLHVIPLCLIPTLGVSYSASCHPSVSDTHSGRVLFCFMSSLSVWYPLWACLILLHVIYLCVWYPLWSCLILLHVISLCLMPTLGVSYSALCHLSLSDTHSGRVLFCFMSSLSVSDTHSSRVLFCFMSSLSVWYQLCACLILLHVISLCLMPTLGVSYSASCHPSLSDAHSGRVLFCFMSSLSVWYPLWACLILLHVISLCLMPTLGVSYSASCHPSLSDAHSGRVLFCFMSSLSLSDAHSGRVLFCFMSSLSVWRPLWACLILLYVIPLSVWCPLWACLILLHVISLCLIPTLGVSYSASCHLSLSDPHSGRVLFCFMSSLSLSDTLSGHVLFCFMSPLSLSDTHSGRVIFCFMSSLSLSDAHSGRVLFCFMSSLSLWCPLWACLILLHVISLSVWYPLWACLILLHVISLSLSDAHSGRVLFCFMSSLSVWRPLWACIILLHVISLSVWYPLWACLILLHVISLSLSDAHSGRVFFCFMSSLSVWYPLWACLILLHVIPLCLITTLGVSYSASCHLSLSVAHSGRVVFCFMSSLSLSDAHSGRVFFCFMSSLSVWCPLWACLILLHVTPLSLMPTLGVSYSASCHLSLSDAHSGRVLFCFMSSLSVWCPLWACLILLHVTPLSLIPTLGVSYSASCHLSLSDAHSGRVVFCFMSSLSLSDAHSGRVLFCFMSPLSLWYPLWACLILLHVISLCLMSILGVSYSASCHLSLSDAHSGRVLFCFMSSLSVWYPLWACLILLHVISLSVWCPLWACLILLHVIPLSLMPPLGVSYSASCHPSLSDAHSGRVLFCFMSSLSVWCPLWACLILLHVISLSVWYPLWACLILLHVISLSLMPTLGVSYSASCHPLSVWCPLWACLILLHVISLCLIPTLGVSYSASCHLPLCLMPTLGVSYSASCHLSLSDAHSGRVLFCFMSSLSVWCPLWACLILLHVISLCLIPTLGVSYSASCHLSLSDAHSGRVLFCFMSSSLSLSDAHSGRVLFCFMSSLSVWYPLWACLILLHVIPLCLIPTLGVSYSASCHLSLSDAHSGRVLFCFMSPLSVWCPLWAGLILLHVISLSVWCPLWACLILLHVIPLCLTPTLGVSYSALCHPSLCLMPTLGVSYSASCHLSLSDTHSGRVLFCFMSSLSVWSPLWACLILLHVISLSVWYPLWACLILLHVTPLSVWYPLWACHFLLHVISLSLSDAHSGRVLFCFMSSLSLWCPLWACLILLHVISLSVWYPLWACLILLHVISLSLSDAHSGRVLFCFMSSLSVWRPLWACIILLHVISLSVWYPLWACLILLHVISLSLSDAHSGRVFFCFMSSLSVWYPLWACLILLHVIPLCLITTLGVSYSASCHLSLSVAHSGRVVFCFMSSLSLSDAHSGRVFFCFMSSLSVWCPLWACLILLHVTPLSLMPTLGVSYSASCHLSLSDAHSGRVLFCFMSSLSVWCPLWACLILLHVTPLSLIPTLGVSYSASCHLSLSDAHSGRVVFCFMSSLSLSDAHSGRVLFCFMSPLSLWYPLWACLILLHVISLCLMSILGVSYSASCHLSLSDAHSGRVLFCFMSSLSVWYPLWACLILLHVISLSVWCPLWACLILLHVIPLSLMPPLGVSYSASCHPSLSDAHSGRVLFCFMSSLSVWCPLWACLILLHVISLSVWYPLWACLILLHVISLSLMPTLGVSYSASCHPSLCLMPTLGVSYSASCHLSLSDAHSGRVLFCFMSSLSLSDAHSVRVLFCFMSSLSVWRPLWACLILLHVICLSLSDAHSGRVLFCFMSSLSVWYPLWACLILLHVISLCLIPTLGVSYSASCHLSLSDTHSGRVLFCFMSSLSLSDTHSGRVLFCFMSSLSLSDAHSGRVLFCFMSSLSLWCPLWACLILLHVISLCLMPTLGVSYSASCHLSLSDAHSGRVLFCFMSSSLCLIPTLGVSYSASCHLSLCLMPTLGVSYSASCHLSLCLMPTLGVSYSASCHPSLSDTHSGRVLFCFMSSLSVSSGRVLFCFMSSLSVWCPLWACLILLHVIPTLGVSYSASCHPSLSDTHSGRVLFCFMSSLSLSDAHSGRVLFCFMSSVWCPLSCLILMSSLSGPTLGVSYSASCHPSLSDTHSGRVLFCFMSSLSVWCPLWACLILLHVIPLSVWCPLWACLILLHVISLCLMPTLGVSYSASCHLSLCLMPTLCVSYSASCHPSLSDAHSGRVLFCFMSSLSLSDAHSGRVLFCFMSSLSVWYPLWACLILLHVISLCLIPTLGVSYSASCHLSLSVWYPLWACLILLHVISLCLIPTLGVSFSASCHLSLCLMPTLGVSYSASCHLSLSLMPTLGVSYSASCHLSLSDTHSGRVLFCFMSSLSLCLMPTLGVSYSASCHLSLSDAHSGRVLFCFMSSLSLCLIPTLGVSYSASCHLSLSVWCPLWACLILLHVIPLCLIPTLGVSYSASCHPSLSDAHSGRVLFCFMSSLSVWCPLWACRILLHVISLSVWCPLWACLILLYVIPLCLMSTLGVSYSASCHPSLSDAHSGRVLFCFMSSLSVWCPLWACLILLHVISLCLMPTLGVSYSASCHPSLSDTHSGRVLFCFMSSLSVWCPLWACLILLHVISLSVWCPLWACLILLHVTPLCLIPTLGVSYSASCHLSLSDAHSGRVLFCFMSSLSVWYPLWACLILLHVISLSVWYPLWACLILLHVISLSVWCPLWACLILLHVISLCLMPTLGVYYSASCHLSLSVWYPLWACLILLHVISLSLSDAHSGRVFFCFMSSLSVWYPLWACLILLHVIPLCLITHSGRVLFCFMSSLSLSVAHSGRVVFCFMSSLSLSDAHSGRVFFCLMSSLSVWCPLWACLILLHVTPLSLMPTLGVSYSASCHLSLSDAHSGRVLFCFMSSLSVWCPLWACLILLHVTPLSLIPTLGVSYSASCHLSLSDVHSGRVVFCFMSSLSLSDAHSGRVLFCFMSPLSLWYPLWACLILLHVISLCLMPTLGVSYSASCHLSLSDVHSGRVLFCFMSSLSVWCPLWACLILLHVIPLCLIPTLGVSYSASCHLSLCLMPTLGVSYSASCHPSQSDAPSGRVLFCFMSSLSVWCPLWACLILLHVTPLSLIPTLGVSYSASCHLSLSVAHSGRVVFCFMSSLSLSDAHSGRVFFCLMSSLSVWCPLWACLILLHVTPLSLMPTLGVSYSASCHLTLSDAHSGRVLFCFMSSLSVWCPLWACLILLHVTPLSLIPTLGVSYSASCHLSRSDVHSGRVVFCFMSSLSLSDAHSGRVLFCFMSPLSLWYPLWACLILLHVISLCLMPTLGVSYSASCHLSLSDVHSGRVLFCFMSSLSVWCPLWACLILLHVIPLCLIPTLGVSYSASCHLSLCLMPTLGVSYSASCHPSQSDAPSGRVLFCFMSSLSVWCPLWACLILLHVTPLSLIPTLGVSYSASCHLSLSVAHSGRVVFCFMSSLSLSDAHSGRVFFCFMSSLSVWCPLWACLILLHVTPLSLMPTLGVSYSASCHLSLSDAHSGRVLFCFMSSLSVWCPLWACLILLHVTPLSLIPTLGVSYSASCHLSLSDAHSGRVVFCFMSSLSLSDAHSGRVLFCFMSPLSLWYPLWACLILLHVISLCLMSILGVSYSASCHLSLSDAHSGRVLFCFMSSLSVWYPLWACLILLHVISLSVWCPLWACLILLHVIPLSLMPPLGVSYSALCHPSLSDAHSGRVLFCFMSSLSVWCPLWACLILLHVISLSVWYPLWACLILLHVISLSLMPTLGVSYSASCHPSLCLMPTLGVSYSASCHLSLSDAHSGRVLFCFMSSLSLSDAHSVRVLFCFMSSLSVWRPRWACLILLHVIPLSVWCPLWACLILLHVISLCLIPTLGVSYSAWCHLSLSVWYPLWACLILLHVTPLSVWYPLWACLFLLHVISLSVWCPLWACLILLHVISLSLMPTLGVSYSASCHLSLSVWCPLWACLILLHVISLCLMPTLGVSYSASCHLSLCLKPTLGVSYSASCHLSLSVWCPLWACLFLLHVISLSVWCPLWACLILLHVIPLSLMPPLGVSYSASCHPSLSDAHSGRVSFCFMSPLSLWYPLWACLILLHVISLCLMSILGVSYSASCHLSLSDAHSGRVLFCFMSSLSVLYPLWACLILLYVISLSVWCPLWACLILLHVIPLSLMPPLGVSYSASCHPSLSDAHSGRVLFCFMSSLSVWYPLWACLIVLHVIPLCLMPTLGVSYSASCHPSLCLMPTLGVSYSASCHLSLSDAHSGRVLFCFMSSLSLSDAHSVRVLFCFMSSLSVWRPRWACLILLHVIPLSVWCPLWACLILLHVISLCLMPTLGVSYSASCHLSLSDAHSGCVLFCFMSSLSLCLIPTLVVSYSASCHLSLSVWCPLWACLFLLHVIPLCLIPTMGVSYSASCHPSLSDNHSGRVLFCFMSSLSVWCPLWACRILLHVISLSLWCPLWACLFLLYVIPLCLMSTLGVSYSASCHPSLSDAHSGRVLFCFMSSLSVWCPLWACLILLHVISLCLMPTLGVSYSASCHPSLSDTHSGRVLFCFMSSLSVWCPLWTCRILLHVISLSVWCPLWACLILLHVTPLSLIPTLGVSYSASCHLSLSDPHSGRVLFCFMSSLSLSDTHSGHVLFCFMSPLSLSDTHSGRVFFCFMSSLSLSDAHSGRVLFCFMSSLSVWCPLWACIILLHVISLSLSDTHSGRVLFCFMSSLSLSDAHSGRVFFCFMSSLSVWYPLWACLILLHGITLCLITPLGVSYSASCHLSLSVAHSGRVVFCFMSSLSLSDAHSGRVFFCLMSSLSVWCPLWACLILLHVTPLSLMPTLGVSYSASCHLTLSDAHSGRVLFCFMSSLSVWCPLWACLILLHVTPLSLIPTLGVSYSASCHLSRSDVHSGRVVFCFMSSLSLSDAHSGRVLFCFMSPLSLWYPLWACLILLHVISLCLMPTLGVSYSASCHLSLSDVHSGRVLFCFMSSLSVWCPLWACLILLHVIPLCLIPTLGVSYSASCHLSLCLMPTLGVSYSASCHPSQSDAPSGRVLFCFMSSLSVWCPLWACLILLHVTPLSLIPTLGVSYSASCHLSLSVAHSGRVVFCFMSSLSLSDAHSGRVFFCFMSSLSVWCPLWACLILLHVTPLSLMPTLGVSYSASCHLSLSDAHSGRVLFCFMSSLSVWCPLWACLILLHVTPLSLIPTLGVSYSASCHLSLSDAHSGRVVFCFMSSLSLSDAHSGRVLFCFMSPLSLWYPLWACLILLHVISLCLMSILGVSYSASCHLSLSDAHSGRVLFCFMSSLSVWYPLWACLILLHVISLSVWCPLWACLILLHVIPLSLMPPLGVSYSALCHPSLSDAHSGRVLFCFMSSLSVWCPLWACLILLHVISLSVWYPLWACLILLHVISLSLMPTLGVSYSASCHPSLCLMPTLGVSYSASCHLSLSDAHSGRVLFCFMSSLSLSDAHSVRVLFCFMSSLSVWRPRWACLILLHVIPLSVWCPLWACLILLHVISLCLIPTLGVSYSASCHLSLSDPHSWRVLFCLMSSLSLCLIPTLGVSYSASCHPSLCLIPTLGVSFSASCHLSLCLMPTLGVSYSASCHLSLSDAHSGRVLFCFMSSLSLCLMPSLGVSYSASCHLSLSDAHSGCVLFCFMSSLSLSDTHSGRVLFCFMSSLSLCLMPTLGVSFSASCHISLCLMPTLGVSYSASCHPSQSDAHSGRVSFCFMSPLSLWYPLWACLILLHVISLCLMSILGVSYSASCHLSLSDAHSGRVLFCFMSSLSVWYPLWACLILLYVISLSVWCPLWACLILLHVIPLSLMPPLGVSYSASCHPSLSDAHSGRVLFCFMSSLSVWYPLWACLIVLHVIPLCLMPTLGVSYSASCHPSLCLMPTLGVSYSASCHLSLSDAHSGRVLFCFMSSLSLSDAHSVRVLFCFMSSLSVWRPRWACLILLHVIPLSVWCPLWACLILLHVISLCLIPTLGVSYSAWCHLSLSVWYPLWACLILLHVIPLSVWCPLWACLILLHVISLCLIPTLGVSYSASCHLSLSVWYPLWACLILLHVTPLSVWYPLWACLFLLHVISLSVWCPLWACLILLHVISLSLMPTLDVSYSASCHLSLSDTHSGRVLFCFMSSLSLCLMPTLGVSYSASCHLSLSDAHSGCVLFCFMSSLSLSDTHSGRVLFCFMSSLSLWLMPTLGVSFSASCHPSLSDTHYGRVLFCFMSSLSVW